MFEFRDSKLGKVKVVNITEARQNMASIMNDDEFNYIITKNNKPIRVVINYQEYKEVKAFQRDQNFSAHKTEASSPSQFSTENKLIEEEKPISKKEDFSTGFLDDSAPSYNWESEEVKDESFNHHEEKHQTQKMIDAVENEEKNLTPEERAYFERFKKLYSKAHQEEMNPKEEVLSDFAENSTIPDPSFKKESSSINWDEELTSFKSTSQEPSFEELKALRENLGKSSSDTKVSHSQDIQTPKNEDPIVPEQRETIEEKGAYQPPVVKETVQENSYRKMEKPERELPKKDHGGFEPPSIQDLLKELESEKLSGE